MLVILALVDDSFLDGSTVFYATCATMWCKDGVITCFTLFYTGLLMISHLDNYHFLLFCCEMVTSFHYVIYFQLLDHDHTTRFAMIQSINRVLNDFYS